MDESTSIQKGSEKNSSDKTEVPDLAKKKSLTQGEHEATGGKTASDTLKPEVPVHSEKGSGEVISRENDKTELHDPLKRKL